MADSSRLVSLDALRGATIAAMIVVNTPGTWSAVYAPLRHADWHGLTPTDLVFPFFLFIVGVSIALAFTKQQAAGVSRSLLHRRILIRTAKIFAVGLFLNLWPQFAFGEIRVAGVLQRIALVFGVVALLFLHLRWKGLVSLTIALLVGYWGLLTLVPVPRDAVVERALATGQVERAHGTLVPVVVAERSPTAIAPNLEPGTNLAAWIDRAFLPGRFYERTWDPEGWLSTLPSVATGLLGLLTGLLLLRTPALRARLTLLAAGGALLLGIGYLWSVVFPMNKNLWTSSFVLVSAGWLLVLFAVMLSLIDGRGWRRWAYPAIAFGSNPITAYVLAGMLTVVAFRPWAFGTSPARAFLELLGSGGVPAELASLLFALTYTAIIFIPILLLHRRRIFIRL
jgi:predicted acyltransferase